MHGRDLSFRVRTLFSTCLRCAFFALLLAGLTASAQAGPALSGTIKDASGAVVGRAIVTLVETKTATRRQAVAEDNGEYRFTSVAPGEYTVEVSAPGMGSGTKRTTVGGPPAVVVRTLEVEAAPTTK